MAVEPMRRPEAQPATTYARSLFQEHADNPRKFGRRKKEELGSLARSIKKHGILEPIVARVIEHETQPFQVIAGARRLRAAGMAKLEEVPAIFRPECSDEEVLALMAIENLERKDLSPMEEGQACANLLAAGYTVKQAAGELGMSERWIYSRARLLHLSPRWLEALATEGHPAQQMAVGALQVIAAVEPSAQDLVFVEAEQDGPEWMAECWLWEASPTDLERWYGSTLHKLSAAPWKLEDEILDVAAGPCSTCPLRSSERPTLFETTDEPDRCLDPGCWGRKREAYLDRILEDVREQGEGDEILTIRDTHFEPQTEVEKAALERHGWAEVKRGTSGARRAVVVDGSRLGSLLWIKLSRRTIPGDEPAKTVAGSTTVPKAAATSLANRKKAHEKKRVNWSSDELLAWLRTPSTKRRVPTAVELLQLAVILGTDHSNRQASTRSWKRFDELGDMPSKDLRRHLFEQFILPIVKERVSSRYGSTEARQKDLDRIAPLLGLDPAKRRAAAVAAKPDPKAWEYLKPDGTPKRGAAAKKKAAKKKAVRKKAPA